MKLFNGILSSIFTVALTISAPLSANANQASDHSNQKGKDNHNREKSSLLVVDDGYKNLKFLSSEARYLSKGQSIENGSFEAGTLGVQGQYKQGYNQTYFSGSSLNQYGHESHQTFSSGSANAQEFEFKDYFRGGDRDFNHQVFGGEGERCHVQPVPEPQTYLLMLVGLVLVVQMSRQRKQL